mgnify:CR=1 FL=1
MSFLLEEDYMELQKILDEKKLRITDLGPIEKFNDNHLNNTGHQYLATYLTNRINSY